MKDRNKIGLEFLKENFNKNEEEIISIIKNGLDFDDDDDEMDDLIDDFTKHTIYSELNTLKRHFNNQTINSYITYLNKIIKAYEKNFKDGKLEEYIYSEKNSEIDLKSVDKILKRFDKDLEIASHQHEQRIKNHENLMDDLNDSDEIKTVYIASENLKNVNYVRLLYNYILEDLKNLSSKNLKHLGMLISGIELILSDLEFVYDDFKDVVEYGRIDYYDYYFEILELYVSLSSSFIEYNNKLDIINDKLDKKDKLLKAVNKKKIDEFNNEIVNDFLKINGALFKDIKRSIDDYKRKRDNKLKKIQKDTITLNIINGIDSFEEFREDFKEKKIGFLTLKNLFNELPLLYNMILKATGNNHAMKKSLERFNKLIKVMNDIFEEFTVETEDAMKKINPNDNLEDLDWHNLEIDDLKLDDSSNDSLPEDLDNVASDSDDLKIENLLNNLLAEDLDLDDIIANNLGGNYNANDGNIDIGNFLSYDFDYVENLEDMVSFLKQFNNENSEAPEKPDFNKFKKQLKKVSDSYEKNRTKFLKLKNMVDERLLLERKTNKKIETKTIPIIEEFLDDLEELIDSYNVFLVFKDYTPVDLVKEVKRVLFNLNRIYKEYISFFEKLNQEYYGYYDEVAKFFMNIHDTLEKFDFYMRETLPDDLKSRHLTDNELKEYFDNNAENNDNEEKELIRQIAILLKGFREGIKRYYYDEKRNRSFKKQALDNLKATAKVRSVDFESVGDSARDNIEISGNLEGIIMPLLSLAEAMSLKYKKSTKEGKMLNEFIAISTKLVDILEDVKIEGNDFLSELKKFEHINLGY
ncbi:MAG: hypothetical protein LBB45_09240 [Methanobrevibacter sp.]|jgi:hypothetical protein|nr:hypothetical protein [Candidatus Methanovirga basalitermitum]